MVQGTNFPICFYVIFFNIESCFWLGEWFLDLTNETTNHIWGYVSALAQVLQLSWALWERWSWPSDHRPWNIAADRVLHGHGYTWDILSDEEWLKNPTQVSSSGFLCEPWVNQRKARASVCGAKTWESDRFLSSKLSPDLWQSTQGVAQIWPPHTGF